MTGGLSSSTGARTASGSCLLVGLALALAACGGGPAPAGQQSSSSQPSTTSVAPPSPGTTDAPSAASPSPSEETSSALESDPEPSSDDTPRPPVLTKDASDRDLTTSDFFKKPEGWQDGRFSAAGKQDLPAVSGIVDDCQLEVDEYTPAVELRLANNFSTISMVVAQGDDSEQSDAVLNVRAEGNGTYKDTAHVAFNTTKSFSVPVNGVNAFKLQFWLSGKKCLDGHDVRVVLTNLRLQ